MTLCVVVVLSASEVSSYKPELVHIYWKVSRCAHADYVPIVMQKRIAGACMRQASTILLFAWGLWSLPGLQCPLLHLGAFDALPPHLAARFLTLTHYSHRM